jgi:hypothetical protein
MFNFFLEQHSDDDDDDDDDDNADYERETDLCNDCSHQQVHHNDSQPCTEFKTPKSTPNMAF